ncbi:unnamed protein product [Caenorhabditis nigoni]
MRKILTFFSLLLIVTANAPAKNNPTNALHAIIEKLESLSRITNGLALQKELNSKSLNIDHLLAEILGIDPNNNGFEELRMFKMDDLSKRYAELSKDAGGVKKSEIDESMVKSQLDVLGKMGEDLEVLKRGEPKNLDEIVEKGKKVFEVSINLFSEKLETFPSNLNNTFNVTGKYADISSYESSFKLMSNDLPAFRQCVKDFMNFEVTFKDLWAINGSFSQLGPLRTLGKVADVYKKSYANLTELKDNMGTLNKDIPVLVPFIKQSSEIINLSKDLGKLYEMFGKFSISNPSTKLLTAGVPHGTQDITRIFQDVNSQWFKKSIANDNEKVLKKVTSDLNGIKVLNENVAKTEVHWNSFKGKNDTVKIQKSLDLVDGASKHVMDINSFTTLQSSSSEVGVCLMNLAQMSVDVNFKELNSVLDKLETIEKAAMELKPLLFEFSKISILQNQTIFDSFQSDLGKINQTLNLFGLKDEVDKLRANPDHNNFWKGSLEAYELVLKIKKTGMRNLLISKISNWDVLTNVKDVLNGTNLIETLECLQQKKFDATGISKLLTFGSLVRSIGDEYKMDKSLETFVGKMDQFQKSLKNLKSSVRPKRSPSNSTVDSLQNGLTVSQDLSKGVDLLRKMGNLHGKKKDLDMVVAGGQEVFQEIQKTIASVDSEKLESEMKKTSEDLQKIELTAKKYPNPSLQAMGEFFENASTIHGVSIDSKLLADPVAVSFEKSSNSKIQGVAVPLKTLGSLQLDFSNGRSDFKSAQLSISKLQEFFDGIFPISRNPQNAESEPFDFVTLGIYGGSGLIFIVILIGLIFVARCIVNDRKRSDPNYYIHLLDSGDESVLTTSNIDGHSYEFLPIHRAIRQNDLSALKRCIKNGANVNAYVWQKGRFWTPLHLAVHHFGYDLARVLIMNGADRSLKDSDYKTAEECIHDDDDDTPKVFAELREKTFRRRLPQQFPKSKYLIYGHFPGRWSFRTVSAKEMATHVVLLEGVTNKDNLNLDGIMSRQPTDLKFLFQNVMIMKNSWITVCSKWWHPWLSVDFKYRATNVEFNGKIYETVEKIHQHSQERRIPFLFGIKVYLIGFNEQDKTSRGVHDALKETMPLLGVDEVITKRILKPKDKLFNQGDDFPLKPYYFDNMGHVFVIVGCPISEVSQDKRWNPEYLKCNRFSVMTVNELLEFLLKFEPHHYGLSGKEDETTFKKWQPFSSQPE